MSYDLGVWFPYERLNDVDAGKLYSGLCDSTAANPKMHPAIDAFYRDLISQYPEVESVPEDRLNDHEYCPWSCPFDRSSGHVIMSCVWSQAERVDAVVRELARKHGLAVFDPQSGRISYPDSEPAKPSAESPQRRAWWKLWG